MNGDLWDQVFTRVKECGFRTGSYHFFGEGVDRDYVCRASDLADLLPDSGKRVSSPEYGDDSFFLFEMKRKGVEVDVIIVSDEEFDVWKEATRLFTLIAPTDPLFRDKNARVAVFETLKKVLRKSIER